MNIQEEIICRLQILIQKADQVIATNKPNSSGVIGFPRLSSKLFSERQAQSINYLINLLGEHHTYVEKFKDKVKRKYQGNVKAGKGILKICMGS